MPAPPDWGTPPWRVDVDIAPSAPPARCDVAVVGGGFTGLSAAYHLAQRDAHAALREGSRLGSGASGRTGGIVLEGTAVGPMERVEHCLDALADIVARERIACELRLGGCWELTHRRESDSRGRLWRDGDAWLCVSDTVPGGTVDPGALVSGLDGEHPGILVQARAGVACGATEPRHQRAGVDGSPRHRVADAEPRVTVTPEPPT